jgi:phage terminase large subunit
LIDYIEGSGEGLEYYVRRLQERPYVYERHLLPHDAKVRELGSGRSRTETLHGLGVRPTRVVRQHNVADGIQAVRTVLPQCWWDMGRCAGGIRALKYYRREWNEGAQAWRSTPVHDFASHGADSLRYMALGVREGEKQRALGEGLATLDGGRWQPRSDAWMGV